MSFISFNESTSTLTINGNHEKAVKTTFSDGETGTQFKNLWTEETNSFWVDREVKHLVVNNAIVYDQGDLNKYFEIVKKGIQYNFSSVFISPRAVQATAQSIEKLEEIGFKVAKGSVQGIPYCGGSRELECLTCMEIALPKIGFNQK